MKKGTKLFLGIAGGTVMASGVVFGTVIAVLPKAKDTSDEYPYREMKNEKTIWFNSGSTINDKKYASKDWDFQIKVYPYANGEYWLDEKGLEKLRVQLQTRLFHGPEITTLKSMIIGNTNVINRKAAGLYFPLTQEMFLNIDFWKDFNNISDDKKIEGLLSTITHEYGHHLASSYLTSQRPSEGWKGADGHKPIDAGHENPGFNAWNPEFMNKFYKTLNYGDTTLKAMPKREGVEPIASKLSLSDLFWRANGSLKPKSDDETYMVGLPTDWASYDGSNKWKAVIRGTYDPKYYGYRYSMPEIVTRQLGQLMHTYHLPSESGLFGSQILASGGSKYLDGFVSDLSSSAQIYKNYSTKRKILVTSANYSSGKNTLDTTDGFYKDYMFGHNGNVSRASEIYENFTTSMGYNKLISNIRLKNNLDVVSIKSGELSSDEQIGKLELKTFQMTGFAPKDVKGVYYGNAVADVTKINTDNMHKFANEEDRKKLWNFNRKEEVLSPTASTDTKISKPSETVDKWIPYSTDYISKVKGNIMRWWQDKNNNNILDQGELIAAKDLVKNDIKRILNDRNPVSTYENAYGGLQKETFPQIKVAADGTLIFSQY